jgi:hypothetical protein
MPAPEARIVLPVKLTARRNGPQPISTPHFGAPSMTLPVTAASASIAMPMPKPAYSAG